MNSASPNLPPMARRSWYLPQADADRLAELVDDLHFTTRRPRYEILAAVVDVVVGHRPEIEARLEARRAASQGSAA